MQFIEKNNHNKQIDLFYFWLKIGMFLHKDKDNTLFVPHIFITGNQIFGIRQLISWVSWFKKVIVLSVVFSRLINVQPQMVTGLVLELDFTFLPQKLKLHISKLIMY